MREVVFRIGLLFFCLSIIACIGMGVSIEDTLVRSTVIFFFFISVIYLLVFIFTKSQEQEMLIKTKLVDELLNDNSFEILNRRIEERARRIVEEEKTEEVEGETEFEEQNEKF